MEKDTLKTIAKATEPILFKDRNSKFYGFAVPVTSEDAVKEALELIKSQHPSAGHCCYAYQLGHGNALKYRANDDGEPNNSAGQPIYGQIQSYDVTNVLVAVVRYFGGTKLGVGGLINAYRTVAQLSLDEAKIIEKTIDTHFRIEFAYKDMNNVMRIIKEKQLHIESQTLELACEMQISIRKSKSKDVKTAFEAYHDIKLTEL
ncbi:YigZ family protein [Winogradskyella maritima]|uniref:IMPACT family protein n=1 Tax=Winogradskyella maritima TaxID=1517766 RepID=A0ABV8ADW4_9FLAO|nr:YigZ family protein [Winogradskyella maritima]